MIKHPNTTPIPIPAGYRLHKHDHINYGFLKLYRKYKEANFIDYITETYVN